MQKIGKFTFVVVVTLLSGMATVAQEPKADNKHVGTWKLVSAKDPGFEYKLTGTTLLHVTPTHATSLGYDENGKVTGIAGGSYALKGDDFVVTAEYRQGLMFFAEGKADPYKAKIEGNKLFLTSTGGLKTERVWERVEKK